MRGERRLSGICVHVEDCQLAQFRRSDEPSARPDMTRHGSQLAYVERGQHTKPQHAALVVVERLEGSVPERWT